MNVVSRLEFIVLSNSALGFAVSPILYTIGKRIKLFTETLLAFSLRFQQIGLSLHENQVHQSEERY